MQHRERPGKRAAKRATSCGVSEISGTSTSACSPRATTCGDRAQVDLGLAAAGHAVQHERRIAPVRGDDRADRRVLFRRQFRAQFARDGVRHRCRLRRRPRARGSPSRAARVRARGRASGSRARRVPPRRQGRVLPGSRRARAAWWRACRWASAAARAGGGAQRPALGGGHGVRATAQGDRQRGRDDLAGRVTVVLRGPAQQVEQDRVEHRLVVDERERALQAGFRDVRSARAVRR